MILGTAITPTGPYPASIAIVGEAPGVDEEANGVPFTGHSGRLLRETLARAGFDIKDAWITNVFLQRPPGNDVEQFFCAKSDAGAGSRLLPLKQGAYVQQPFVPRIVELQRQLHECRPTLVIALGNTALWAIAQVTGITTHRGALRRHTFATDRGEPHDCYLLPTFHPAAVLRNHSLKGIFQVDIEKAYRAYTGTLKRAPTALPTVHFSPDRRSLLSWVADLCQRPRLAVDIETHGGQISMIGFAPDAETAFVVPIFEPPDREGTYAGSNYWPTLNDEIFAVSCIKDILQSDADKVFQNGMYDIQYIWRKWRFPPLNCTHDTMLLHHAEQPEMQKGLGFLSSIYLDNPAWKAWRNKRGKQKDIAGKEE